VFYVLLGMVEVLKLERNQLGEMKLTTQMGKHVVEFWAAGVVYIASFILG
jgi:hypothetical protein